jgi:hypothetical protein
VSSTSIPTNQGASDPERSDTSEASVGSVGNSFQSYIPIGNDGHSEFTVPPSGEPLADVGMNDLDQQDSQLADSRPATPIYNPFSSDFGFDHGIAYNSLHFCSSQDNSIQGETEDAVARGHTFTHPEILSPAIRQALDQICPPRNDL